MVTSCAGYPLDLTFYQAIKGITAAQHIVKPGGNILLLADARRARGHGNSVNFCNGLRPLTNIWESIGEAPVTVDQWQLEKLALVTQKAEVLFYTPGLPTEFHKTLWDARWRAPRQDFRADGGTRSGFNDCHCPRRSSTCSRVRPVRPPEARYLERHEDDSRNRTQKVVPSGRHGGWPASCHSLHGASPNGEEWRTIPLSDDRKLAPGWQHLGWGSFTVDHGLASTRGPARNGAAGLYAGKFGDCQIRVSTGAKNCNQTQAFISASTMAS